MTAEFLEHSFPEYVPIFWRSLLTIVLSLMLLLRKMSLGRRNRASSSPFFSTRGLVKLGHFTEGWEQGSCVSRLGLECLSGKRWSYVVPTNSLKNSVSQSVGSTNYSSGGVSHSCSCFRSNTGGNKIFLKLLRHCKNYTHLGLLGLFASQEHFTMFALKPHSTS